MSRSTEATLEVYNNLPWSGHKEFQAESLRPWYFHDSKNTKARGGEYKSVGRLTLVTVDEAGHMSPYDQPIATTEIIRGWIQEQTMPEQE